MTRCTALAALFVVLASGCASSEEDQFVEPACESAKCDGLNAPEPICSVSVRGFGNLSVEDKYLAGVVACEAHANAGPAALRAQAIAARSWMYAELAYRRRNGRRLQLSNDQNHQVYQASYCRQPQAKHIQAVRDTEGQILMHRGVVTQAFYVAGATQSGSDCSSNRNGRTERFVTYNEGRAGTSVRPSKLGHPANPANRGCMSQHGAMCLDNQSASTESILRYYYGDDINLVQVEGSCITPPGNIENFPVDVGASCSTDADCGDEAPAGSCTQWFDADTNEQRGMCVSACSDRDCPSGSQCVSPNDNSEGVCMPVPTFDNPDCSENPGTEVRVLGKPNAGSAFSDWRTVCSPPQFNTMCEDHLGTEGECLDVTRVDCNGQIAIGLCPGDNDVRCCLPVN